MNKFRLFALLTAILLAALSRWLPHPPNFTPILAMGLFGGAFIRNPYLATALPLLAMFLSDCLLGFHPLMGVVYGCVALNVLLGKLFFSRQNNQNPTRVLLTSFFGAVLFFIIVNFAVWAQASLYPLTGSGLISCYIAALPFFKNTLLSTVLYSFVLFRGFGFLEWKFPKLQWVQAHS